MEAFPGQIIDQSDIKIISCKDGPSFSDQFKIITGLANYPEYLEKDVVDTLNIYCNGEINYTIKESTQRYLLFGITKRQREQGTHQSIMRVKK